MLKFVNQETKEKVKEVYKFASSLEGDQKQKNFADRILYLATYGQADNVCILYPDFAPHSFTFSLVDSNNEMIISGGLIYSEGWGWSVHT